MISKNKKKMRQSYVSVLILGLATSTVGPAEGATAGEEGETRTKRTILAAGIHMPQIFQEKNVIENI